MFTPDFSSMLSPQMIVNFIKNSADIKKLANNLFSSQECKDFIVNDLGYDYESLKSNLFTALASTKRSEPGIKKQRDVEESKKLENYRSLANNLIKKHGLSLHSAIILASGFVGIEKFKVSEFLKQKGYSASEGFVEKYYNKNENFLKSIMKKDGVIVPGWNDEIESSDLEIESSHENKKEEKLVQVPDDDLEEEFKK